MVGAAQFSDDFSDGNFTSNPIWAGDNANFEVDANGFLHLNAPAVADESFLSVASVAIDTASWEFSVRLEFNPSSSNRARVYLVSSDSNLKGPLNGYYVLIGNTEDEISLYRQSGTTVTKIIDGVDDLVDTDPVEVKVLVTRSTNGDWELFADTSSSANYQLLGQVTDTTFQSSTFFGVWCDYTSTRSDKFYFDDFHVSGNAYLDVNPPLLLSAQALSNNQVLVTFNEAMDQTTAQNTANYNVNNAIGAPTSANLNGATQVILSFTNTFSLGSTYTLSASSVEDLSGNALVSTNSDFQYKVNIWGDSAQSQVYHYIYSFCHTATQKRSYWFSYGQFSIKRRVKNPKNAGFTPERLHCAGHSHCLRIPTARTRHPWSARVAP